MGVIPDRFVNIKIRKHASIARIKQNLVQTNQELYGDAADDVANKIYSENEMH